MKKYGLLLVFALSFLVSTAQDKKTVKEYKIRQRVESVVNYEDGLTDKRVVAEQIFDKNGRLIELKDWSKEGKIKEWSKFTYTPSGAILTEVSLNAKGKVEEKVVYTYKEGLKVKKSYYDSKERLVKEKFYDYEYYK